MKSQLMYVEQKKGYSNGRAWIGKAFFSKTGKTVYFNGQAFHRGRGIATEIKTGEYYWISGVKKNGEDKHWADNQPKRNKVMIDKEVVDEYLLFRGLDKLPLNIFEIVELDNIPAKEEMNEIENLKLSELEQTNVLSDKYSYATRNRKS